MMVIIQHVIGPFDIARLSLHNTIAKYMRATASDADWFARTTPAASSISQRDDESNLQC